MNYLVQCQVRPKEQIGKSGAYAGSLLKSSPSFAHGIKQTESWETIETATDTIIILQNLRRQRRAAIVGIKWIAGDRRTQKPAIHVQITNFDCLGPRGY